MNEYEILLSYLDKQKKPKKKSEEFVKVKSFEDIPKPNNTEKILEECKEEKLPTPQVITNSTLGFDADKFENLMRSRLIDDYKKMQSYERPYISVTELFYCLRNTYISLHLLGFNLHILIAVIF